MRTLENEPEHSQRELAKNFGVSLGSVNFCLKELIKKGYVKAKNFKNSRNKSAFAYILTPSGLQHKTELTIAFLKRKQREYEELQEEILRLREDLKR